VKDKEDDPRRNLVYTIKWKGYSHLHDTYELFDFLKNYKGFKRVENYVRHVVIPELELRRNPNTQKEDIELLQIEKERQLEMVQGFMQVERVLDQRTQNANRDVAYSHLAYLCKWKGLAYADCTWEVSRARQRRATCTLTLAHSGRRRDRQGCQGPHRRIPCPQRLHDGAVPERELPARPPQVHAHDGAADVHKPRRHAQAVPDDGPQLAGVPVVEGPERHPGRRGASCGRRVWWRVLTLSALSQMGLGKTVQTVSFFSYLFHSLHQYGPFLVVVPLSTLPAWMQQFENWAPDMNVISYTGNTASREMIRQYEFGPARKLKFNVLVTTYEFVLKDRADLSSIKWAYLAVDEVSHNLPAALLCGLS
jgi:chromodomain-helicase-DNA-binding protein 1